MILQQFIVDAFVMGPFSGNPAAVCLLDEWPADDVLQSVAAQNNLSETAFLVSRDCSNHELRWFTPLVEVELCGHATLACAHVLSNELHAVSPGASVTFLTGGGPLTVEVDEHEFALELPAFAPEAFDGQADDVLDALGLTSAQMFRAGGDLVVVIESESAVTKCEPDFPSLSRVGARCVCLTAPSDSDLYDFVARVFAPAIGINEDPATGSAQCGLAPYWSRRLSKDRLLCFQASARGAELKSEFRPESTNVKVRGRCSTFSRGSIELSG